MQGSRFATQGTGHLSHYQRARKSACDVQHTLFSNYPKYSLSFEEKIEANIHSGWGWVVDWDLQLLNQNSEGYMSESRIPLGSPIGKMSAELSVGHQRRTCIRLRGWKRQKNWKYWT